MASAFEQVDCTVCATNPGPFRRGCDHRRARRRPSSTRPGHRRPPAFRGADGRRPGRQRRVPRLSNKLIEMVVRAGAGPGHRSGLPSSQHLRQPGGVGPPAPSTVCRSACRCWPPPPATPSCSTSAYARARGWAGRWSPRRSRLVAPRPGGRPALAADESDREDDLGGLTDLVHRPGRDQDLGHREVGFHAATRSAMRPGVPTRLISSANSDRHLEDRLVAPSSREQVLDASACSPRPIRAASLRGSSGPWRPCRRCRTPASPGLRPGRPRSCRARRRR